MKTEAFESKACPRFLRQCAGMRREIVLFSGMTDYALREAATELNVDYHVWCMDHKGSDLPDAFMGFCQMLREWSYPWSDEIESSLNGFQPAQYHFAFAFDEIEVVIGIATGCITYNGEISNDDAMDQAAISAISAAKALVHAKHLMTSNLKQEADYEYVY